MGSTSQWKKLRDKKYREEFVAAQCRRAIPFQIRALMRKKKMSQQELAEKAGLTQGVISRAANPAYGKLALNTIIRVAAGFDVAFIGVFVPFSKLVDFYDKFSEEHLSEVATFTEEDSDVSPFNREPDTATVELESKVLEWNRNVEAIQDGSNQKPPLHGLGSQLPFPPTLVARWSIRHGTEAIETSPPEPVLKAMEEASQRDPVKNVPASLEGQRQPLTQMAASF